MVARWAEFGRSPIRLLRGERHAFSRVVRTGMLGVIPVEGAENSTILQPKLPGDPWRVHTNQREVGFLLARG